MNEESRGCSRRARDRALPARFLDARGFLEVETPMLQPIPGGAAARPFKTHHNALDMDMYLRIAPELYLKRLTVGGFERVYEINRNFRNEGVSTQHNPEFTMLELYQAYADYTDSWIDRDMFQGLADTLLGTRKSIYQGTRIRPVAAASRAHDRGDPAREQSGPRSDVAARCRVPARVCDQMKIPTRHGDGAGKLQIELFEKTGEHTLMQPTFAYAYPAEVSPLSRRNDQDPFITDRFEFFIGGRELANGFSELNDAEDQAQRFKEQVERKDAGDEEAMYYDADYVRALEYGMPPAGGLGVGIDRLVMFFTDSPSIRDVLLFPHMRPETCRERHPARCADRGVRFRRRRPDGAARAAPRDAGEDFIYLGDTARLPYGTKSAATVVRYSLQCARRCRRRGIRCLVVACNTASASALGGAAPRATLRPAGDRRHRAGRRGGGRGVALAAHRGDRDRGHDRRRRLPGAIRRLSAAPA
jgi:elongation factor P--beta-lysine ligase